MWPTTYFFMLASSNGTFSALLALCELWGESTSESTGHQSILSTKANVSELRWLFSLMCAWTNVQANNQNAGNLRRHRAHYDVTVMLPTVCSNIFLSDSLKKNDPHAGHVTTPDTTLPIRNVPSHTDDGQTVHMTARIIRMRRQIYR